MLGGARSVVTARCGVWPTVVAALLSWTQNPPSGNPPSVSPPPAGAPAAREPAGNAAASSTKVETVVASEESGSSAKTSADPVEPVSPTAPPAADTVSGSSATTLERPAASPAAEFKPIHTSPWEYSPYKIRIWVAAEPAPELGDAFMARLRRDLEQRLEAWIGAPWIAQVTAPAVAVEPTVAMCPQLLNEAMVIAADKDRAKDDKLILVRLSTNARSCSIWAREFDWHARTWGPPISNETRQPAAVLDHVYQAVVTAFGPLGRIEDGQGKTCVIRGRAIGLVTSAESVVKLAGGDILQPIYRQNDRFGEPMPGKTEAIPFTFLQVVAPDPLSPSLLNCNVHSGMRSPIRGRSISSSRRERWALKVRPLVGTTTLFVENKPFKRTEAIIPLSGIEVYSKTPEAELPKDLTEDERKIAEKKNPPEMLGVTDWRGALTFPSGGPTLRLVYLKNGGLLLARLPIVPGLHERLVAAIPDDNPRLQAEGFVRGMNSEVTDLVVQRQLIALRMRKRIGEGKLDDAEKLFEEFRGLKTLNDLQQMLNVQLQRQKPTSSTAVQQKIDKLYGDERELLAKYIDAELQVKLLAELSQARANPPLPSSNEEETAAARAQRESANPAAGKEGKKSPLPSAVKTKGGEAASTNPSNPATPSPESLPASTPPAQPVPNP